MYQPELIIGVVISCLLHIDTTMAQPEAQPVALPSQTPSVAVDLPHSSDDMPKMNGSNCMDPVSQPQYTVSLSNYKSDF